MYKFKKSKIQLSGTHWCHRFEHAYFVQGRPELLVNIHLRKTPNPRGGKVEISNEVIIENRLLKARVSSMEHTIFSLQAELNKLRNQGNQATQTQRDGSGNAVGAVMSAKCCPRCGQELPPGGSTDNTVVSNKKRKAEGKGGDEADAADACVQLIKLSRAGS